MSIVNAFSRVVLGSHTKLEFSQFRFRRRIVSPPPWIPPMHHPVRANLYKHDRKFVDQSLWSDPAWRHLQENEPLQFDGKHGYFPFHLIPGIANPPDCRQNAYNADTSKRIGMVGRKIGMTLQWMKDGTRCLCTMIHFPDNVVLSANDPETWYRQSPTGKRKAFGKLGPSWSQLVGAFDDESVFYTKPYRQIFNRVGVPCKKHIGGFIVSEDAVVQPVGINVICDNNASNHFFRPGTRLDVRHFQVGQFVNVSGKTIDWGFQGVVHRWGMRGLPSRRTTKAHRRIGSIGAKGEAKVWPGRKLPGHMGYEWRLQPGLLVLRINPIEQVIYVRGCVPGDIDDEMLLVNDCMMEDKRVQIPTPSFPTFYPRNCPNEQEDREKLHQIYNCTSRDLYHPNLFQFTQPSVLYTEADETKSKVRDKTRAKTAKVKKN